MKVTLLVFTIFFLLDCYNAKCQNNNVKDSTVRERFIRSILEEPDMKKTWLLVRIDSLNLLPNNYELVHPYDIYQNFAEHYTSYTKKRFIYAVFDALINNIPFERYSNVKNLIKGIKVEPRKYKPLAKISFAKVLKKYFNENCRLKKKYQYLIYELIAVCYINNMKVTIPKNGSLPFYEVFK